MADERRDKCLSHHDELEISDGEFKEDIVGHQSDPGVRRSERSKVSSIKGREYQGQLLQRDYKAAVRAWQKQANKSKATLADIHTL